MINTVGGIRTLRGMEMRGLLRLYMHEWYLRYQSDQSSHRDRHVGAFIGSAWSPVDAEKTAGYAAEVGYSEARHVLLPLLLYVF